MHKHTCAYIYICICTHHYTWPAWTLQEKLRFLFLRPIFHDNVIIPYFADPDFMAVTLDKMARVLAEDGLAQKGVPKYVAIPKGSNYITTIYTHIYMFIYRYVYTINIYVRVCICICIFVNFGVSTYNKRWLWGFTVRVQCTELSQRVHVTSWFLAWL